MFDNKLVQLRPRNDTLYIARNRTVLATGLDGFVHDEPNHGLFVHRTRLLSRYECLINGQAPKPVALSNVDQHSWIGYYITTSPGVRREEQSRTLGPAGIITQQTLEVHSFRVVGDGLQDDMTLTNYTQHPISFDFAVNIDADFADPSESSGPRQQRGILKRKWNPEKGELRFAYTATHGNARIDRAGRITVQADSPAQFGRRQLSFQIRLEPHGQWHLCLRLAAQIDGNELPGPTPDPFQGRREAFISRATTIDSPRVHDYSGLVVGALNQAGRDLASLRLYDLDINDLEWTVAAGLPVYLALFGRDTLTSAWQAAMLTPQLMRGTLGQLARWQGKRVDDWRDEQPGKMIHEVDTAPLPSLNFGPNGRYYGSITTSGFYPVVLAALWHWTGNKEVAREYLDAARKALQWADEYADLDGDGFYEYETRSPLGLRNQSWKDSDDSMVHADGSLAEPPIATCEEQGFIYLAKVHMAELLWWLDEKSEARRLRDEAQDLKARFNRAFWLEEEQYFAMALDKDKRPLRSISSNPGHCLAAGIIDDRFVPTTVERLFAPDLFNGWGIRTLSSKHPAYNPYSYHRGAVWPVEQGTFGLGLTRYGFHEQMQKLCRAQFEAAALFELRRLPELFAGHQRDDAHPFPALYPDACWPQAWSASAVFLLVQSMLGLYPYAPLNLLLVDPHLPEWLPEITLRNLKVGSGTLTINFFREPNGNSNYEVSDKEGAIHVFRQPSPWSITADFGERLKDLIASLVH